MIVKRHMKQAQRAGDGEIVQGFLLKFHNKLSIQDYLNTNGEIFLVNPGTIEDVAVMPKSLPVFGEAFTPICPNCEIELNGEKYCPYCGQHINWGAIKNE